uniref:Venom dipeptidyl peptidase 4 n=1 Tax=Culicoides sonorensis TaxID=179676 RepID=A0A336K9H3_CULSO
MKKYLSDQAASSAYQVLSQFDEDFPQLTQAIDEKEEDIEYIYSDSSDDEIGITHIESDSSVDILFDKKRRIEIERRENLHQKFNSNKNNNKESDIEDMANYGSYFTEELVASKKNKLLRKFLIYGFIALVAIAIIVILSVFLTRSPNDSGSEPIVDDSPSLGLEDFLEGRMYPSSFNGSWAGNDKMIFRDKIGNVILHNVRTNSSQILIPSDKEPLNQGVTFSLSYDEKFLLVARDYRKLFRSSFSAIYDILNVATGEVKELQVGGVQAPLLLAEWNPKSNGIIFNYNYDLYYKKSPEETEIRITTDGKPTIYNGVPDWVYEEEVFSSNTAYWFSPDGNLLSFIKFDDTQVPFIDLPIYGPAGRLEFQYPNSRFVHYPKSGAPNPKVTLIVANLEDLSAGRAVDLTVINPPSEVTDEHIIATVAWADNSNLITVWMNRIQNKAVIRKCQLDTCETIASLESNTGWIELFTQPLFNADGSAMAILASQPQENDGGPYRHVTMIPVEANGKQIPLTKGKFVVTELMKWNPDSNTIFYTANMANSSESKHLFAIKGEANAEPQCLTCGLISSYTKRPQDYFDADFSKDGSFFILSHKGPDIPEEFLYTFKEVTGKIELQRLSLWEKNEHLEDLVSNKAVPQTEIHEIPITGTDFTAKVMLQVPRTIDRSGRVKYPMLVDVYGGPDSFSVVKKFTLDWGSHLASNKSIIYARIDGRGSGLRGDKLLHQIYKKLGTVEIQDQINTARKLSETLPYIDPNRIGIWGWSYGGYASGLALAKDTDKTFKCAASVAPVTDWMYYDSIYTERFMDVPQKNLQSYIDSRLSTMAEGFRDKQYLLIHGTLDDNVHFQQSMALAKSLEKADILFKEVSYPDEDHGLVGVRPHLYHTLGKFFNDCFGIKSS